MTTRNGGMPAMPLPLNPGEQPTEHGPYEGLTKREQFAMAAMQGLLSGGYCIDSPTYRIADVPHEAVNLAVALLAELDEADREM